MPKDSEIVALAAIGGLGLLLWFLLGKKEPTPITVHIPPIEVPKPEMKVELGGEEYTVDLTEQWQTIIEEPGVTLRMREIKTPPQVIEQITGVKYSTYEKAVTAYKALSEADKARYREKSAEMMRKAQAAYIKAQRG